jgi:hypothetical protein
VANDYQLYLDAATVAAGDAQKKGLLDIPTKDENDTLYERGKDKKWREHFVIKQVGMEPWADKPEVMKFTCQFRVLDDSYEKNQNRVMTITYWVNTKALKNAQHEEYKRTMMAVGTLNAIIRASGMDIQKDDAGRVAYHEYFKPDGPLTGVKFWGVVRDYWYVSKKHNEEVNVQEISSFLPNDK